VTSERKIRANRANAQASTGPKTERGRLRAARNALRHALSRPVYSDPIWSEEVEALAREIIGADTNAEIRNSPAALLKRRSIYVACVTRGIRSYPKH